MRQIVDRPAVPWYNNRITLEKRRRRQLERKWRKSKFQIDHDNFKSQRDLCKHIFAEAKSTFYHQKIQDYEGDQKALFEITNHLMHRKTTPKLPNHTSSKDLAHSFSAYFTGKIEQIRGDLLSNHSDSISPVAAIINTLLSSPS